MCTLKILPNIHSVLVPKSTSKEPKAPAAPKAEKKSKAAPKASASQDY